MWEKVLECESGPAGSIFPMTTKPSFYIDEVYTKYTSGKEKLHSLADVYINSRPESSWEHLVQTLYDKGELAAAKEAKSFLQQNGGWYCYSACMTMLYAVRGT